MRYLVAYDPNSNEWGNYSRYAMLVEYTSRTILRIAFKWDSVPAGAPRGRVIVKDAADAWVPVTPYASVSGDTYSFSNVQLQNGYSCLSFELETPVADAYIMQYPFVCNDTAGPLPNPQPYTALRRLEIEKHVYTNPRAVRVPYPPKPPYVGRAKPRAEIVGKNPATRLAENQLWTQTLWAPDGNWAMRADFVKGAKGDVHVKREQKYFYSDAVSFGGAAYKSGLQPPRVLCRDGNRTSSSQGYISQVIIRDNLSGFITVETGSRCAFTQFPGVVIPEGVTDLRGFHPGQGYTDTIWGWHHDGDAWRYVGDFRYLLGVTAVQEPWQISMARRMPDGSVNLRSGFTQWVGDPLTGDLLAIDIYPRHPQLPKDIPATFMPVGYVRPADATEPVFYRLTPNAPGTWGNCFRPQDEKLYFTNVETSTISRIHHSGADKEVLLQGKKTLAELGYSTAPDMRLHPSTKTIAELRSFIVDGPLATASLIRPQFIINDPDDGTLIFSELGSLVVRRLDPVAGTVVTFQPIPESSLLGTTPATWTKPDGTVVNTVRMLGGASSSGTQDPTLWIDDGTIGARGDVYMSAWGTTHKWAKDGTYKYGFAPLTVRSLRNGRSDLCGNPTYAWGGDTFRSVFIHSGNDGYTQFKVQTPLRAGDYVPSSTEQTAIIHGGTVYNRFFYLTHGCDGYGVLGYPNVEEMGSWNDTTLTNYLVQWGGAAADAPDFIKWVRYRTLDIDYSQEDPAVIAELQAALAAAQAALATAQAEANTLQTQVDDLANANAALQAKIDAAKAALA